MEVYLFESSNHTFSFFFCKYNYWCSSSPYISIRWVMRWPWEIIFRNQTAYFLWVSDSYTRLFFLENYCIKIIITWTWNYISSFWIFFCKNIFWTLINIATYSIIRWSRTLQSFFFRIFFCYLSSCISKCCRRISFQ